MPTCRISRSSRVRHASSCCITRPSLAIRRLTSYLSKPDTFTKHQVDRPIPVESLIKCKMQDNLEFLQWSKRYWDQYFPGEDYDALARRKASGAPSSAAVSTTRAPAARRAPSGAATVGAPRAGSRAGGATINKQLEMENKQLNETVTGLERERDFYFSKLRDIELLIQQAMEAEPELEKDEGGIFKQIQTILYSTEVKLTLLLEEDCVLTSHRKDSRSLRKSKVKLKRKPFDNISTNREKAGKRLYDDVGVG